MIMSGTPNINPQGYTYAIEPNTTHPFWKSGGSGESNYIYADLKSPVTFENTDTNFTRFDAVLQGDVPFIAPLTLSLVSVTINSEVALPFVGVAHGDVAFLICEGISTNQLKVVGVYATTDMSELQITDIKSIPAPIKGDKGDNGKDGTNGVTPDVTATATVDQTTGNASVTVTKTGTETQPAFNFAFTGLKGERGETGQTGATGERGATGEDGKTPDITVIATVDETTGTPAVDVTKSGTTENPIFDFAFSGLKGESGGGSEWKTLENSSGKIVDIMTAINNLGGTEVLLDNLKISGFQSSIYFNIVYADLNGVCQKIQTSFSTQTINQLLHEVVATKISNKWVCTGKIVSGSAGTSLRFSDGSTSLTLYEPKLMITTNNLGSDLDVQLVLSIIGYSSAYLDTSGYSGTNVLSVGYGGGFYVETIDAQPVPYR